MKITVTKKSSVTASKKPVTSATSVDDMLDAFEERLAELGVQSSTEVEAGCHGKEDEDIEAACGEKIEASENAAVVDNDYEELYRDVHGSLGENGAIYSLAELKDIWNKNKDGDPIMMEYASFQDWFNELKQWFDGPRYVGDVTDDDEELFD